MFELMMGVDEDDMRDKYKKRAVSPKESNRDKTMERDLNLRRQKTRRADSQLDIFIGAADSLTESSSESSEAISG